MSGKKTTLFVALLISSAFHLPLLVPGGGRKSAGKDPAAERKVQIPQKILNLLKQYEKAAKKQQKDERKRRAVKASLCSASEPAPKKAAAETASSSPQKQTSKTTAVGGSDKKGRSRPSERIDCSDLDILVSAVSSGAASLFLLVDSSDGSGGPMFYKLSLMRRPDGSLGAKRGKRRFEYVGAFQLYRLPELPHFRALLDEVAAPHERHNAVLVLGVHRSLAQRLKIHEESFCKEKGVAPDNVRVYLCALQWAENGFGVVVRGAVLTDGSQVR